MEPLSSISLELYKSEEKIKKRKALNIKSVLKNMNFNSRHNVLYEPTMMFVVMLNEEQFPEVKVVSKSEQMSLCLTQKLLLPLLH